MQQKFSERISVSLAVAGCMHVRKLAGKQYYSLCLPVELVENKSINIQTLIIDNDTDIGLTSDFINGTYKTFSSTDLSNNVYTRTADLSSNVYTQLNK